MFGILQTVPPASVGQQAQLICERLNAHTGSVEQTIILTSSLPPESLTIRTLGVSTDSRFLAVASGDHRHVTLWDLKLETAVAKYTIAKKWASHEIVRIFVSSRTNRVVVILRAVDDAGNDVSNKRISHRRVVSDPWRYPWQHLSVLLLWHSSRDVHRRPFILLGPFSVCPKSSWSP